MSSTNSSSNSSRISNFTPGIMVTLMGGLVLAIGFGVIGDPSKINVPLWLIAIFGSMFILGGMWAILQQAVNQQTVQAGWMNFIFGLLMMLSFSVLCLWISFGANDKIFMRSYGPSIDQTFVPVDPTTGRIFFGGFGFLMFGLTVAVTIFQGRKMLHPGSK